MTWPARALDLPGSLQLTHCAALPDGWVLAGGHSTTGAAFSDVVWVCRTRPDGKRLWTQRLGSESDHTQLACLAPLANGGLALGGSRTWRAGEDARGFVTTLDARGRERWGVDFGQLESNGVGGLCAAPAGGCVYARHEYLPTTPNPTRDDWRGHDFLCGLDAKGLEAWRRELRWPVSRGAVAQLMPWAGGVAALVAAAEWGAGAQDFPLWLTLAGGELQQTPLRASRIAEPLACAPCADGGAAVLGGVAWSPVGRKLEPVLLRLGPAVDVRWERSYGDPERDVPTCLAPAAHGGFVVGGIRLPQNGGHPPATAVWLLGLDADGEPRWRQDLHSGQADRLGAVDVDRTGRVLAVGSTRTPDGARAWTLSLNAAGEPDPWFSWRGLRLWPPG